ncbi:hypothetical protein ASPCAL00702 [Aspergillus calidoustus]|uniref:Fungal N-terminal domain-containing protein n=1 Tax=Aspergillus calidoustus TaxID=454130 RepID=A0A0U5FPK6_ASPCI|nr:hypothetical protein ASPCAL00702 [Aspergillus calidoustus]
MADPFSIAGSTVGVISLGLQVCGLLITYCRSVKDADQDIRSIPNKASGLRVPLKTLRDILEEYEFSDTEAHPWTLGSTAQSDIRDDLNEKDTLRDMIRDLDEIQMNLHTSLHVYSLRNMSLIPYMVELQKKNFAEVQQLSRTLANNVTRRAEERALGENQDYSSIIVINPNNEFLHAREFFIHVELQGEKASLEGLIQQHQQWYLEEFLVDSGTPVDTTTEQGQTALDILCTVMGPQEERSRRALQDILSEDEDVAVFPEIAKIILREHDSALREALNSGLANVNDTTQSLTLLEISIGWPKGLQILLEAGADISRYLKGPHDPISRAICLPCRNSLNVLLKAGCNIRTYQLYDDYDLCAESPEIVLDIVEGLAARRKRLRDLARCHLPLQQLPSLMPSNTLPDTTAAGLIDDLIARRVAVDSALWVEFPGRSVYHAEYSTKSNPWKLSWKLPYLGVDTMEALYKVGFHDIDATDSSGRTPLMTIPSNSWALVPTIRWFISKGANLFRILPRSHATVFHYLACLLVCGMPVLKSEYNPLSYYIIHAPIQDNCLYQWLCEEFFNPIGKDQSVSSS